MSVLCVWCYFKADFGDVITALMSDEENLRLFKKMLETSISASARNREEGHIFVSQVMRQSKYR